MTISSLPAEVQMIADRLLRGMEPEKIYLFGSHARGDAVPDSDFDFLVVVSGSSLSRYERSMEARGHAGNVDVPLDIVVLTRKEWDSELRVVCSLSSTVLREGFCLHG